MKILNHLFLIGLLATGSWATAGDKIETRRDWRPDIVGGTAAEAGEFPYIVSLQTSSKSHFCGGSLIKKSWVLTAGHCADAGYLSYIVVGLNDMDKPQKAEIFKAKRVITHPQFSTSSLDYDFALIELDGESQYEPVGLNHRDLSIPDTGSTIMSTAAGWGVLNENSYSISNKLMKVRLPLVSSNLCGQVYQGFNDITDRMICAGYAEGMKDACQGDSGGPLVVNQGGEARLVGVVSWGYGCARPQYYGVYSKVSSVIPWIRKEAQE